MYQEQVVRAWIAQRELKRAERLARQIDGWRQIALLADLSAEWQQRQDARAAARLLAAADAGVAGVTDWPRDRVRAHIARARAMTGDAGPAQALRGQYSHDPDTRSRLHGSAVLACVVAGRWDDAIELVRERPPHIQVDDTAELTHALCVAAGFPNLPTDRRLELLELAWAISAEIPGWKSSEVRIEILRAMLRAGKSAEDVATELRRMTEMWKGVAGGEVRWVLLSQFAELWGDLREVEQVRVIASLFHDAMEADIQPIDRPALWARLASAHARAGDGPAAAALFTKAIDTTTALVNLRPRAMGAVHIALAMASSGYNPEHIHEAWTRLKTSIHAG